MDNELYHHGVKGMKWGVRRKRLRVDNSTSQRNTTKVKDQVQRGMAVTKKFLNDNGPALIKGTAMIALCAVGAPYAMVLISNYADLDLSAFGLTSEFKNEIVREEYGPIKSHKMTL